MTEPAEHQGTRIYIVFQPGHSPRLVRARHARHVVAHISRPIQVRMPSQEELIKYTSGGVKIENANGT